MSGQRENWYSGLEGRYYQLLCTNFLGSVVGNWLRYSGEFEEFRYRLCAFVVVVGNSAKHMA